MSKTILLAACVISYSAFASSPAFAQGQAVDRGVAVIDLRFIFEHYPRFKELKAVIDNDVKLEEEAIKTLKAQLESTKKLRDEARRGTTDYERLDGQLTQQQVNLQARVQQSRKKFMEREASIYANAYTEIVQEVDVYATHYGFSMVLRFNNDVLNDEERGEVREVAKHLNKPVVWLRRNNPQNHYDANNRDITPAILDRLSKRNPPTGAANNSPTGVPRGPQQR